MADKTDAPVAHVLAHWDELGILEHQNVLHMPASLKRRDAKGGIAEVPVMLRNVTNHHKIQARKESRAFAVQAGLDLDRDSDMVTEFENYAILSYAIRDPKTFIQHMATLPELLHAYDTQTLAELWGRYNVWVEMLDPRFGELGAEDLWRAIGRIAKDANPSFLAGMRGAEQFTCIVLMAQEALLSPNRPSWLQPLSILRQVS